MTNKLEQHEYTLALDTLFRGIAHVVTPICEGHPTLTDCLICYAGMHEHIMRKIKEHGVDNTTVVIIHRLTEVLPVPEMVDINDAYLDAMKPKCSLCGLEDGACICAHIPQPKGSA